ncbi:MAG TPA: TetR/AcrR family transcriptional regulator [Opitutaceae bacterium]|jgi:TetR/AcrR family fatty acid metabolism transcriptional regulator|nr:TetR/AcrR family transcriptional regulator [Opitutaceae bacterium]
MSQEKKQRIMQAAEEVFRTRQFHEVTLDEVARVANVGKGTIYLYFSDKEDLFFQTAVAGFDGMCELLRADATGEIPFRDGLLRMCMTISGFFRERRPLFRLILAQGEHALECGGSMRQRWLERRKNMAETTAAIIAQGIAAGDIRSDIPAEVLAEYLLGMLRTRAWELEDRPEEQRTHEAMVELFISGAAGARTPS